MSDHRPILDLNESHFVQAHGDITVFGTWYGTTERRPCLVLLPTYQRMDKVTPCIIPIDNAWKWAEETGDVRDVARSCFQFCQALGLDPYNQITVMRVLSIIRDHMGDLLSMPAAPVPQGLHVTADAVWKDEQGKEHHREIYDV